MNRYWKTLPFSFQWMTPFVLGLALLSTPALARGGVHHGASCDTATSVTLGDAVQGHHDWDGDLDYFAFDVPTRGVARIQVDSTNLGETRLQLLGDSCLGLSPVGFRSLGGTDTDRLVYFERAGRQVVRVRGGGVVTRAAFDLRVDFVAAPSKPTARFDAWVDVPGTCVPVGDLDHTTDPPPEEEDMDGSQIAWGGPDGSRVASGGFDHTTDPPPEEEDMDGSQIAWGGPDGSRVASGGFDHTTDPPPEEEDMDGSQIAWPTGNDDPRSIPVVRPDSHLRVAGALSTVTDQDVLAVRVTHAGLLDIELAGSDVTASLYRGEGCVNGTPLLADAAIHSSPLVHWVEPGVYQLRLSPRGEVGGAYQLALRMLAFPGQ